MSGTDVFYFLRQGKRLDRPSRCPSKIYQTMLECWEWDETKRPTFSQLHQVLKIDVDSRESNISHSVSSTAMSRTRTIKATLSSSTLTNENIRSKDVSEVDKIVDDLRSHGHTNEQYKSNGNAHVTKTNMRSQQTFTRDRIKS